MYCVTRRYLYALKFSLHFFQALSLLLSLVLRSLVSTRTVDDDIEGDYDVRVRTREPLLNSQVGQASGSIKGDSDIWSSRMREKVPHYIIFLHETKFP